MSPPETPPPLEPWLNDLVKEAREEFPGTSEVDSLASKLGPLLAAPQTSSTVGATAKVASGGVAKIIGTAVLILAAGTIAVTTTRTRESISPAKNGSISTHAVLENGPSPPPLAPTLPRPTTAHENSPQENSAITTTSHIAHRDHQAAAVVDAPAAAEEAPVVIEKPPEVLLLSRAQNLLANDPRGALSVLTQHHEFYEHGALAQEREVLAIQALLALQDHDAAVARANAFRTAYPTSALLRRVDVLISPPSP